MIRNIISIILIIISIAIFFVFVNPMFQEINAMKKQTSSFEKALVNSNELEKKRNELVTKSSSIPREDLNRLNKLVPDAVDNIRLILEIEEIAHNHGMYLKDVSDDDNTKTDVKAVTPATAIDTKKQVNKDYGTWNLGFSVEGDYKDFLGFVEDLENNLRIVDISSIKFLSDSSSLGSKTKTDVYRYSFKIKTYWLKN